MWIGPRLSCFNTGPNQWRSASHYAGAVLPFVQREHRLCKVAAHGLWKNRLTICGKLRRYLRRKASTSPFSVAAATRTDSPPRCQTLGLLLVFVRGVLVRRHEDVEDLSMLGCSGRMWWRRWMFSA